jgi:hypothetical protein
MNTQNATPTAPTVAAHDRRRPRRAADLRGKIADSTVVQAAIAGLLSFTHIRDVAEMGGQTGWKGWAYPLIVDLVTVSAYRKLKGSQASGEDAFLPWAWLIIGTAASISANIIDAIVHAPAGASTPRLTLCIVVGVWPAVAFFGTMLLRHSDKPTGRPAGEPPAAEPVTPAAASHRPAAGRLAAPTGKPNRRPAPQPATRVVRPANGNPSPASAGPRPIPVQPTGKPGPFGDLGPRAATAGELPLPVWVQIGRPTYQLLKNVGGDRPTERELQAALSDEVARLIADGALPAAVGKPSLSTAKRVRRAIEEAHPELKAIAVQPRRMAAITA